MKFLFDLFPVILFFGIFKWGERNLASSQQIVEKTLSSFVFGGVSPEQAPIILATAVAIIATFAQIAYLFLRKKKIEIMLWVSLVIIVIFGGATIYFQSETFIKWKPTVLYWCFAFALLISKVIFKKNLIQSVMQAQINLPEPVWTRLCYSWIAFLLFMGIINLYVAFWGGFNTSVWVNFKLFGGMGLMFIFVIIQSVYLSRHIKETS